MEKFEIIKSELLSQVEYDEYDDNSNCCYLRKKTDKTNNQYFEDNPGYCCSKLCKTSDKCQTLNQSKDELEYEKLRQLLNYEDAPKHLQFNPFIRSGYRRILSTKMCLESVFWWTNETINIWSHIFGCFLFIGLTFNDVAFLNMHASLTDKVIVGCLLFCFQACMVLSSFYHTFSCRSEKVYECFLAYDLFGIALSLLAIYISGIYYAFWCHATHRNFYTITVAAIFVIAMVLQIPRLNVNANVKMLMFVAWAAYGVVPTLHWVFEMGGFENTIVRLLLPRVIGMYLISGLAFLIYITKTPERWFAGKFDYLGHSHNWWHFFVLAALYYWHNTGMIYVEFRMNHGCATHLTIV